MKKRAARARREERRLEVWAAGLHNRHALFKHIDDAWDRYWPKLVDAIERSRDRMLVETLTKAEP